MDDMVLLDLLQVGKILFKNDQNLSDKALKERVLRMYLHGQIPMTKFGKTYRISLRSLDKWITENNI